MSKKVIVTGAGLSGLSAAAQLAIRGFEVEVYEKNDIPGGRARHFKSDGFTFDMGPTWYWFPEIFENFFRKFGYSTIDFYKLDRLNPAYRIFYGVNDCIDVPAEDKELFELFETIEKGSSKKLKKFLKSAYNNYQFALKEIIYKPGYGVGNYLSWFSITRALKHNFFSSYSRYIKSLFKENRLQRILEFPITSLGGSPQKAPCFYNLMNYVDLKLGTWYPQGGIYKIVEAILKLLDGLQVSVHLNSPVENYDIIDNKVTGIYTRGKNFHADYFVASADYYHAEQLLAKECRNYSDKYWDKKKLSPSALIYFLGVNKKLDNLQHHNLFYDASFDDHLKDLYDHLKWPEAPVFYVSCCSKTDKKAAPAGMENLVIIIPVTPGLEDTGKIKEHYYDLVTNRLEHITQQNIRNSIVYKKSYAQSDFITDYNAFQGNAYGLANTLKQSGFLKPKIRNRHLTNMFYTGQLTLPGPGMPSALVSGEIAASEIDKLHRKSMKIT